MSLKQEIETWVEALALYDSNEYEESLRVFDNIADTSKILFNCGVIHATLGEHDKAVECFQRAIRLDQYFAVAYFQQGVSNFLVGDFEEALANFNDTLLYLRGNNYIDYEQLGLKFKLYSCEVLFNRGLCYIYLQQAGPGMKDFEFAQKEKITPDHDVIDDAIRENAEGYTVFSIPVGVIYRPNEAKVKNLKTKDYLGKARLVAASDRANAFTGFAGSERKAQLNAAASQIAVDDRPAENISFAASNLVDRSLTTRGRQQSEPPMNRNVFPPTPPPEADKMSLGSESGNNRGAGGAGMTGRAASVRNGGPRQPLQRSNTTMARENNFPAQNEMRPPPPAKGLTRQMTEPVDRMGSPMDRMGSPRNDQMRAQDSMNDEMSMYSRSQYGNPAQTRPQMDRPRMGTIRTASEPRGPSRQYTSVRSRDGRAPRPALFRETTDEYGAMDGEDRDELYDMYTQSPRQNMVAPLNVSANNLRRTRSNMQRPAYIAEEGEDPYASDAYSDASMDDGTAFDMVPPRSGMSRMGSRRPAEIKKIRVKCHANDDTRYIMIEPGVQVADFEQRIQEKFKIRGPVRIKIMDEGDMVTMADQDDLDVVIQASKAAARREKMDMGKMEVWIAT